MERHPVEQHPSTSLQTALIKAPRQTHRLTVVKTMRKFDGAYLSRFIVPTNYSFTICSPSAQSACLAKAIRERLLNNRKFINGNDDQKGARTVQNVRHLSCCSV